MDSYANHNDMELAKLYSLINVRQKDHITFTDIYEFIKTKLNLQINNISRFIDYFRKEKDE